MKLDSYVCSVAAEAEGLIATHSLSYIYSYVLPKWQKSFSFIKLTPLLQVKLVWKDDLCSPKVVCDALTCCLLKLNIFCLCVGTASEYYWKNISPGPVTVRVQTDMGHKVDIIFNYISTYNKTLGVFYIQFNPNIIIWELIYYMFCSVTVATVFVLVN